MKLIIDTNSIISALVKDSSSRKIIFNPKFQFYCPETVFFEIEEHLEEIIEKTKEKNQNINQLLKLIKSVISIIPKEVIVKQENEAKKLIEDLEDVPIMALALAIPNQGIWTADNDFLKQEKIKIWSTEELLKLIK